MNAVEILSLCRNSGITLAVDADGKLHVRGDKDVIATLREDIKAHKAGLVTILQEAPQGGAAATPTSGQAADVTTPVKYARRRSLASTPPPHTGALTDDHDAFLYSVIRNGVVERGVSLSARGLGPNQRLLSS